MTEQTKTPLTVEGSLACSGFLKPNYNITFNKDGEVIGTLDFNGPKMVFSGSLDESAKVFFDYIAASFAGRLADERKASERKAAHFDALREALDGLLGEIESLDDYSLTRDTEHHKAQFCWDYAIDKARTVLLEATEAAK